MTQAKRIPPSLSQRIKQQQLYRQQVQQAIERKTSHPISWVEANSDGNLPAFFWLTENAETNQEVQAVRGSYKVPGTGDPEKIISWGAESAGSGGKNLMDNAPENYLALCVPVMSTEDNPDYQPDEEEPDFDPREKITKLIYVFAQGWCIASPPPEE